MGNTFNTGRLINGLFTDANGNVGIGTTSPIEKLSVIGNIRIDNGAADGAQLVLASSGFSDWNIDNYSGNFRWYYGTTERMRLTNAGNLAVGTSSPVSSTGNTRALQIGGSTIIQSVVNNQSLYGDNAYYDGSSWRYATSNNAAAMRIGALAVGDFTFHSAAYATAGSSIPNWDSSDIKMTIKASGNVGIGTSSPNCKLDILGNTSSSGDVTMIRLNNNNGENCGNIDFDNVFGNLARITGTKMAGGALADDGMIVFSTAVNSALSERMRIRNNGSIMLNGNDFSTVYQFNFKGISGLDCFAALSVRVDGNNIINFFNSASNYVASISVNASSVSYGTGSDYRLKEDLRDFDGLAKISAIKVYDFKFKQAGDRMEGVLAHELQEIIPYAVNGYKDEVDENGLPKIQNVDYSKIVPVLIKSVQQLKAEIEILKNK